DPYDPVLVIDGRDAVVRGELEVAEVVERRRARRLLLAAPPGYVAGKREIEQIVSLQKQLVGESRSLDDQAQIADCAQPVLVRRRPVVVDDDPERLTPTREGRRQAAV